MPRVRFTLRAMMIAVAIVAVTLSGAMMRRRRAAYRERAAFWAKIERGDQEQGVKAFEREAFELDEKADQLRRDAEVYRQRASSKQGDAAMAENVQRMKESLATVAKQSANGFRLLAKKYRAQADRHGDLRQKYQNAARHPWRRVSPDSDEADWVKMLPALKNGPPPLPPF